MRLVDRPITIEVAPKGSGADWTRSRNDAWVAGEEKGRCGVGWVLTDRALICKNEAVEIG